MINIQVVKENRIFFNFAVKDFWKELDIVGLEILRKEGFEKVMGREGKE